MACLAGSKVSITTLGVEGDPLGIGKEIEILSHYQIRPGEWDAQNSLEFWEANNSLNPNQKTRLNYESKKKDSTK